ncbi:hypothetical protein AB0I28_27220 [Phytomonospora sp. NPDC050363]|uniref:hypothetical protein n=1 Tax=Phytomonospora sp. NPDC050363 TaxID=3155642 RepID=UPI0033ED72CB
MQIIGSHPAITGGDIRRLVSSLPISRPVGGEHAETVRLLAGGYSGSLVALVWPGAADPLVVKCGPQEQIIAEHSRRREYEGEDTWLHREGLDGISDPVEVSVGGKDVVWRVIAYRYIGARSFEELTHFSDFEGFVKTYLWSANRDVAASDDTLRACFRAISAKLGTSHTSTTALSQPLTRYLGAIRWDSGILAVLNTAKSFCPDLPNLNGFREWWDEQVSTVRLAPVHDDRKLHGDARFANVLVDSVHAEVEVIDFEHVKRGHVFEDFARFEMDLLFRTVPRVDDDSQELDRSEMIGVLDFLLRDGLFFETEDRDEPRHLKCFRLWRHSMSQVLPQIVQPGALMMYRWFLLRECLKRTRWLDTDITAVVYTICALRKHLSGDAGTAAWISTAPQTIASALHCQAVYAATPGSERRVNNRRNQAKKAAIAGPPKRISTIRLLAETGQSYLSPRGVLHDEVEDALANGSGLQIVICNPAVPEYFGLSESYGRSDDGAYQAHPDLLSKTQESIRGYSMLRQEYGNRIELRLSRFGLGATVLLTHDASFYEPYFRVPRALRQRHLFDSFELQFDAAGAHSRRLLEGTFDFYWHNSDEVDDITLRSAAYDDLKAAFLALWNRARNDRYG